MAMQTIQHESGQLGMWFGDNTEFENYAEKFNNSKSKRRDHILAPAYDYLISGALNTPSTAAQRFKANITAIRVLKELRDRHSSATRAEQEKLALYSGWGAVSDVFDETNSKSESKRTQLKELLSESEYISARASTISAFYTPYYLSRGIYSMLKRAGFNGGRIIDPAAGMGGLIASMPTDMFDNSQLTLVELDSVTAESLEHLYPSAKIYANSGFEELDIKSNLDLTIQNPPFGSAKVIDQNDAELNGLTLHNYFLSKGVKCLRMGGLMVAIVSTSFLDSKRSKAREIVANLAELKGAIRLPKEVFYAHAGANASVDVLLLQRTENASAENAFWLESYEQDLECGETYNLNNYYVANPSAILGVMEAQPGINGKQVQCVSDSKDIVGDVQRSLEKHFPHDIYAEALIEDDAELETVTSIKATVNDDSFIDIGGFAITDDNEVAIRISDDQDGNPRFEVCQEITGKRAQRIIASVSLKQALYKLLELERTDGDESIIEDARALLNETYTNFTKRNGYIQESANRRAFGRDPFFPNLASLELDFNAGVTREQAKRLGVPAQKPFAKKAEIFSSRVIAPWVAPTTADTTTDALWLCWNTQHNIDFQYIAQLVGKSIMEVKTELVGSLVFLNPVTNSYEFAETYLSGDVKRKFEIVRSTIRSNTELRVNFNALEAIIPKDIPAVDISVEINAGWLPERVVQQFFESLLSCSITAEHQLGQWFVKATGIPHVLDVQQFGLTKYPASKIVSRLMAGRELVVRYTRNGRTYFDREATMQVESIAEEIKTRFGEWIWADQTRRNELSALYNEKFNRFVKPSYSGEMLTFPGQNAHIDLRQHQKTAVRRSLEQSMFLMDYSVGAGKTYAFASIVETWHRLGLKQRTAVVLPNHLVEAIAVEWLNLYPTAKLLVLSPEDMSASKRRETLHRIKTGSRIVLIPETTFKAISLPRETELDLIQEEIWETKQAIMTLSANFSVKKLETKVANLEYDYNELTNRKSKDEFLDFAELGFDSIVADEAHGYKNLKFHTVSMSNTRGLGNPEGSQRSWDMFCKLRYLKENFDHAGVVFSTGTPISNSIVEIYSIFKFLNYDYLRGAGLHWLDNWADLYTTVSSEFEIDATGANFKPVSRLREFKNLPELQAIYGCVAETVTKKQLKALLPKLPGGFDMIPHVVGGKPQTVFVDPSEEQKTFIDGLVERARDFKQSPIDNDNMLLLMFHARCASLDLRILDPEYATNSNSKVVACADRVADLYRQYDEEKGTQIVFCDLSTPNKGKERFRAKIHKLMKEANSGDEKAQKALDDIGPDQVMAADSNFSVYDDMKQQLIERGIAEHEIAYAQNYRTPKAKAELFLQLNNGVKRVVLASTQLLGTGANINHRAVAVHHLDPTYKPSCMEQRTGRIERQGNKLYESNPADFEGVHVIYYATRNSLDSFLFQMLESKASWIEAFRSCENMDRVIASLSGDSLTFAEIKAEVSGNALVLEHLQLSKAIDKLSAQQRRHHQQQHQFENSVDYYSGSIARYTSRMALVEKDISLYENNKLIEGEFEAVLSGFHYDNFKEAAKQLKSELEFYAATTQHHWSSDAKFVMRYQGFGVGFSKDHDKLYLELQGNADYSYCLVNRTRTGEKSLMHSVNRLIDELTRELSDTAYYKGQAETNLAAAQSQVGKSFDDLEKLIDLKNRLNEVKHELMAQNEEQTQEDNAQEEQEDVKKVA